MEVTVRHSPSFAVARVALQPSEPVRAESGSMMATSHGVAIESKAQGGIMKSLKRSMLGGESFFITTYTAPETGGWVDAAARLPGDIVVLDASHGLNLTKGTYLASAHTVEIDTSWGGFKNVFGGEGGFMIRANGTGPVVCACYGALDVVDLQEGERFVLDSGHLVAYTDGVNYEVRKVAKGIMTTMKSGEGLVFEFTGPGRVWVQSRNIDELVGWLTNVLPFSRD